MTRSIMVVASCVVLQGEARADAPAFALDWLVHYNSVSAPVSGRVISVGPDGRKCTFEGNGYDKPSVLACPTQGSVAAFKQVFRCPKGDSRSWTVHGFPAEDVTVSCRSRITNKLVSSPAATPFPLTPKEVAEKYYRGAGADHAFYADAVDPSFGAPQRVTFFTNDKAEAREAALAHASTMYGHTITATDAERETEKYFELKIGDHYSYRVQKLSYFSWNDGFLKPSNQACSSTSSVDFQPIGVLKTRPLTAKTAQELGAYHRGLVDLYAGERRVIHASSTTTPAGDFVVRFYVATTSGTNNSGDDLIDVAEITYVVNKSTGLVFTGCQVKATGIAGEHRPVD